MWVVVTISVVLRFHLMLGGTVERGGSEEEAGGPPGEHIKPGDLLRINMDSKTLHLYAQAIDLSQTHFWCFAGWPGFQI